MMYNNNNNNYSNNHNNNNYYNNNNQSRNHSQWNNDRRTNNYFLPKGYVSPSAERDAADVKDPISRLNSFVQSMQFHQEKYPKYKTNQVKQTITCIVKCFQNDNYECQATVDYKYDATSNLPNKIEKNTVKRKAKAKREACEKVLKKIRAQFDAKYCSNTKYEFNNSMKLTKDEVDQRIEATFDDSHPKEEKNGSSTNDNNNHDDNDEKTAKNDVESTVNNTDVGIKMTAPPLLPPTSNTINNNVNNNNDKEEPSFEPNNVELDNNNNNSLTSSQEPTPENSNQNQTTLQDSDHNARDDEMIQTHLNKLDAEILRINQNENSNSNLHSVIMKELERLGNKIIEQGEEITNLKKELKEQKEQNDVSNRKRKAEFTTRDDENDNNKKKMNGNNMMMS